ncbi:MAG: SRPBCC domain-containing protein [Bacteroidetes bacterium]|nr:MAG: SRPBCC domain-containing protein [Bacteroidota bacterium]
MEKISNSSLTNSNEEEFVITRVFNAPREVVFKAWTEPEHLAQWWGPKGFTMIALKIDLRPGGIFHYHMKSPTGNDMWGRFVYRKIVIPERLEFIVSFSDEHGGITRHPLSPTWPLEMLNIVTFTESEGKTTITLRGEPFNATEEERKTYYAGMEGMEAGFGATMDQLDEYLTTMMKGNTK